MHGSVTYIQVYITGVGGASRNVGQQTYSRKLFVQGGYEWLVIPVSIVYLLTFCVFELLGMVS